MIVLFYFTLKSLSVSFLCCYHFSLAHCHPALWSTCCFDHSIKENNDLSTFVQSEGLTATIYSNCQMLLNQGRFCFTDQKVQSKLLKLSEVGQGKNTHTHTLSDTVYLMNNLKRKIVEVSPQ